MIANGIWIVKDWPRHIMPPRDSLGLPLRFASYRGYMDGTEVHGERPRVGGDKVEYITQSSQPCKEHGCKYITSDLQW